MADKFMTMQAAVKELGEAQALKDLNQGYQQRMYRKDRNMKTQALLDVVRGTPELKKRIEAEIATRAKKTA